MRSLSGAGVLFIICCASIMIGCKALPPEPERDTIFTSVKIVERIDGYPDALAITRFNGTGVCEIEVRRDVYPDCLAHEVMHCFSGNWHAGKETEMFCDLR